jgi:hypothetical protein
VYERNASVRSDTEPRSQSISGGSDVVVVVVAIEPGGIGVDLAFDGGVERPYG